MLVIIILGYQQNPTEKVKKQETKLKYFRLDW